METPRPAATKLHRKLKNRMYRFAERHSLTGFEAAGIMFALATEVMASALVRDGLLQGGQDFEEEAEEPDRAESLAGMRRELQRSELAGVIPFEGAPEAAEVAADAVSDDREKLLAIIDGDRARIAQLKYEARLMSSALEESGQAQLLADVNLCHARVDQLEDSLRELAKLAREIAGDVVSDDLDSVAKHLLINHLLERCGLSLTIPTQEPQP